MPAINDLRSFLEVLRVNGELLETEKEVDWRYEIGSIIDGVEKANKGAAFFYKVKDREYPVCGALLSSVNRIALALNCPKEAISEYIEKCLDHPLPPLPTALGLCQEIVWQDKDINLDRLPIPLHAPKDAGRYITSGLVFARDLDGGPQNISYHRMEIKDQEKMLIFINEWRHLNDFYKKAEERKVGLPISIVIGADPVLYIAAGLRCDGDEIDFAGALRGAGIPVVKSITNDILVPATAEFVIEAIIVPTERELEGPLGEFTGHYSQQWMNPVLQITAITMRKNPIYQTINGASFEHVVIGNVVPREPVLKRLVKFVSSNVVDVHIPPYGSGFMAIIKLKKQNPGEPKNVALAAMTSNVNIKNVIVVDEDIDIYNAGDVWWAVSNRVIPDQDIFYIPHSQNHELDPSADERGVGTKMGIDATLSATSRGKERVIYPKVNLADWF
ncbi:MAG: UbiD family decarboxylase [Clostridia bacterium]